MLKRVGQTGKGRRNRKEEEEEEEEEEEKGSRRIWSKLLVGEDVRGNRRLSVGKLEGTTPVGWRVVMMGEIVVERVGVASYSASAVTGLI
jgi:hypothetical protein